MFKYMLNTNIFNGSTRKRNNGTIERSNCIQSERRKGIKEASRSRTISRTWSRRIQEFYIWNRRLAYCCRKSGSVRKQSLQTISNWKFERTKTKVILYSLFFPLFRYSQYLVMLDFSLIGYDVDIINDINFNSIGVIG